MAAQDPLHWERSYAVLLADQGLGGEEAVRLARQELGRRAGPAGLSALAWAQSAAGQHSEALASARRSLAEGTQEPLLLFRAGAIAARAGASAEARSWLSRALELNPEFHPSFPRQARALLRTLQA